MQRKLSALVLTFLLFVMVTSTAVPAANAADEPSAAAGKLTLKEGTEVKRVSGRDKAAPLAGASDTSAKERASAS